VLAEDDGAVAGYVVALARVEEEGLEDEIAHSFGLVSDLAVSAAFRGQGIGSALLAAAERHVRGCGQDDFRIGVLAANRGAHALYRRHGFAEHHIEMRKKLVPG
jgi:ribosomal protein S18 acetylase RimI-like enzyme